MRGLTQKQVRELKQGDWLCVDSPSKQFKTIKMFGKFYDKTISEGLVIHIPSFLYKDIIKEDRVTVIKVYRFYYECRKANKREIEYCNLMFGEYYAGKG